MEVHTQNTSRIRVCVCVYGGARVGSCECERHSFGIASGCLLAFVEESRAPCSLPGLLGHPFLVVGRVPARFRHVRPGSGHGRGIFGRRRAKKRRSRRFFPPFEFSRRCWACQRGVPTLPIQTFPGLAKWRRFSWISVCFWQGGGDGLSLDGVRISCSMVVLGGRDGRAEIRGAVGSPARAHPPDSCSGSCLRPLLFLC